ncbi:ankyrin repeat-containing domain protein [Xylariaceae sp. FL0594]|nr:ankyrin repeat-containing domain protein [Xylariaceae sp. FL0594]
MDLLKESILFSSLEQQETERLRERNRVAKRASRARQKQRENSVTASSKPVSKRRQSQGVGSAAEEHPSLPFPTPESMIASQPLESPASLTVLSTPSDENWTSGLSTESLSQSSGILWENSISSLESPDPLQQLGASSPLLGGLAVSSTTSQLATSFPFHSLESASVSPLYESTPDIVVRPHRLFPAPPPYPSSSALSNSATLLHIAIRNGTKGIVSSLVKFGTDVNTPDASGSYPLHVAVELRQLAIIEILLNHGACIDARNSAQMTPLEVAVRAQDEQIVNFLLSRGAELY